MDIASLSVTMNQQNVLSDVGIALLSKSLDTMENVGQQMVDSLEASVTPHLGQSIDYRV